MDSNLRADPAYPTLESNSTLLPLLLLTLATQKNSPDPARRILKEYDYIIVGAGTAGSVVASRLTEIPCVSVLLLEAGPPTPLLSDIVAIGRNFWFTDIDWQYKTVPQRYTGRGLINRQVTIPSGKTFGGSSVLNGAMNVRGNREDYDGWAAMGAEGWSYEEVLPYFKRLEDNQDYDYVANGYHGVGGPITVMRPRYEAEIKGPIFRAATAMGYKIVDPNAATQTGFYDLQANERRGQRCSTAKAYLVPAENRTNLDIVPNAFVRKVIIENRRAVGVSFDFKGQTYSVKAKREVIVSAGAINTPQILMLSGIGPEEDLRKFNIPVHADLPVGKNFMDQVGATADFVLRPNIQEFTQKLSDDRNIAQFIFNRSGPLCSTEGVANIAFLKNDEVYPVEDLPNHEIYFSEGSTIIPKQAWNLRPEVYEQVYGPYENTSILICVVQQLEPRSRGTIKLQSDNPYVPPLIDPNYLADPTDADQIVEGLKTCRRILNSRYTKNVVSGPFETLYPGCEGYADDEDEYFQCQVRSVILTLSHYSGTAKMGHPDDPTTVVDPKLRVKGIRGLRVVDTSIMPKIVHGNTGVPAIMIGEKASDIIKESIQCYQDRPHSTLSSAKLPQTFGSNKQGMDLNLRADPAYPTLVSNSTLLPLLLLTLASQKNSPDPARRILKEYDYIIVGAGTAGSVVASRLTELPCVSVLLLEAGPPTPLLNDILAIARNFWFTDIDWQYKTVPQKYTGRGLINRQLPIPSGKTFGGSSALNAAVSVRGNRRDYDGWAAMGAKGWSYEEVLPYFKKLEDNQDYDYVANGYHGVGGPITVMRPRYESVIIGPIFRAATAMGYKIVDSNAAIQTGFNDMQINSRNGQRCSTGKAYLVPAENRTNLDILPNAFVRKVIIENRRAVGVSFDFKGRTYDVKAKREVIVSAGAINTPQILMLSGIGPKEELKKFKIPVHADLPVGKNFMDHVGASTDFVLRPFIKEFTQKLSDDRNIAQFIFNRSGPLCSAEGATNTAFLQNGEVYPQDDLPNHEIYFSESSTIVPRLDFNLRPEVYEQVYGPYENRSISICLVQQLEPRSRGTIKLQSDNPYVPPLIDPNYLEDPRDADQIVEGLKNCRKIMNSLYMKSVVSGPLETLHPGCERYAADEDKYFQCQVRSVTFTLSHYCGTAKMGHPDDPTTVVDPKLRVKGIRGLRVVDNSIMPKIVHGNTGVPAIMIGEKASDIIKESIECYQQRPQSALFSSKIPPVFGSNKQSEHHDEYPPYYNPKIENYN